MDKWGLIYVLWTYTACKMWILLRLIFSPWSCFGAQRYAESKIPYIKWASSLKSSNISRKLCQKILMAKKKKSVIACLPTINHTRNNPLTGLPSSLWCGLPISCTTARVYVLRSLLVRNLTSALFLQNIWTSHFFPRSIFFLRFCSRMGYISSSSHASPVFISKGIVTPYYICWVVRLEARPVEFGICITIWHTLNFSSMFSRSKSSSLTRLNDCWS